MPREIGIGRLYVGLTDLDMPKCLVQIGKESAPGCTGCCHHLSSDNTLTVGEVKEKKLFLNKPKRKAWGRLRRQW